MPLWTRDRPPSLRPDAILTPRGWADPITGELLIVLFRPSVGPAKGIIQMMRGTSRIHKSDVSQTILGGAYIDAVPVRITRKVITGRARIKNAPCPTPVYTGINPNW